LILATLISFLIFAKRQGMNKQSFSFEYDRRELILLIIAVVVIFLLIFNVHYTFIGNPSDFKQSSESSYPFPYHADEWAHLAQARYILDEGKLPFINPYFYKFKEAPRPNFESGFHVFLAEYFILTGVNPVLHYQYLPALFVVLSALFLYLFARKLHSKTAGFLGMLFFVSIKSNINILGNWFFTPSSFAVLFLFAAFYFALNKNIILLSIIIVTSAIVYPPIALFVIISSLYFFIKNKKYFFLISGIVSLFLLTIFFFRIPVLVDLLSKTIFLKGWAGIYFEFQRVEFSFLILALGFYGLFTTMHKKTYRMLSFFAMLNVLTIVLYLLLSFTLIMPIPRVSYFLQIAFSVFAAIGTVNLIHFFPIGKKFHKNLILLIISIILIIVQFQDYPSIEYDGAKLSPKIDQDLFEALSVLDDPDKLVMADALISNAIYPISGNNIIAILTSNIGGGDRNAQYEFHTTTDCSVRQFNLENNTILRNTTFIGTPEYYIVSRKPLLCEFFDEIYNKENIFIYSYTTQNLGRI